MAELDTKTSDHISIQSMAFLVPESPGCGNVRTKPGWLQQTDVKSSFSPQCWVADLEGWKRRCSSPQLFRSMALAKFCLVLFEQGVAMKEIVMKVSIRLMFNLS